MNHVTLKAVNDHREFAANTNASGMSAIPGMNTQNGTQKVIDIM